jgi:vitamin B12 transporter
MNELKKCLLGMVGMVCAIQLHATKSSGPTGNRNSAKNPLTNPINSEKFSRNLIDSIDGEILDEVDIHQVVSLGNRMSLRKSGMNVSLITREMIQQLPVQNVNELLSHIAGVDIRQRGVAGVQADIGIRGSSFDQVLVLIDGVRMSDPQTGHHQMNLPIPLNAIKYIEVIKGGAAHKYGLNALAGVVNIVTVLGDVNQSRNAGRNSTAAGKLPQIEVDVFLGSMAGKLKNTDGTNATDGEKYNQIGARIFVAGRQGNWNYWLGSETQKGNGYRLNTEYLGIRNTAGVSYQKGRHHLNVLGGTINNQFGASYFYAAPRDTFAQEEVNTQFLQGKYQFEVGKKGELELQLSSRWNYDHFVFREYNPQYYQNYHSSRVDMQRLQYSHQLIKHGRLGLGLDLRQESLTSTNLGDPSSDFKRKRSFSGAFVNYTQLLFDRLTINAGVYALTSNSLKNKLYPGIEMNYQFWKRWNLFGNYGLGQRLPTFTDLYYRDPVNQSNPNLRPEFSESYELGIKSSGGGFFWGLSYFQRNVFEMIDWVRPDISSKWMPVNQNKTSYTGTEGQVSWKNALWISGLDFGWSYCLLQGNMAIDSGLISKSALNYLGDHTTFRLNYQWNRKLTFGLNYRYFERINSAWSNNNSGNPGYGILDAKLKYTFNKNVSMYINGMNLLNTQYREIFSVPLAPRWVQLGIVASLK